jgi:hypothetical protein
VRVIIIIAIMITITASALTASLIIIITMAPLICLPIAPCMSISMHTHTMIMMSTKCATAIVVPPCLAAFPTCVATWQHMRRTSIRHVHGGGVPPHAKYAARITAAGVMCCLNFMPWPLILHGLSSATCSRMARRQAASGSSASHSPLSCTWARPENKDCVLHVDPLAVMRMNAWLHLLLAVCCHSMLRLRLSAACAIHARACACLQTARAHHYWQDHLLYDVDACDLL